jgi:hypothetical protein
MQSFHETIRRLGKLGILCPLLTHAAYMSKSNEHPMNDWPSGMHERILQADRFTPYAALQMPARLSFAVEQRRAHAVHVEMERERKPDRPAAHDGDLGRLLSPGIVVHPSLPRSA